MTVIRTFGRFPTMAARQQHRDKVRAPTAAPPPVVQTALPRAWSIPQKVVSAMLTALTLLPALFGRLSLGPATASRTSQAKPKLQSLFGNLSLGSLNLTPLQIRRVTYWRNVRKWEEEQARRAQEGMEYLLDWEYAPDRLLDRTGVRYSPFRDYEEERLAEMLTGLRITFAASSSRVALEQLLAPPFVFIFDHPDLLPATSCSYPKMQDPTQGIQRELQPHVHLLSTYRFPTLQNLHPDKVAEWLLSAPKIARDQAPFYWTYLDRPVDTSILLVWQSMSLGPDFPSDGYIWAPAETAFQVEVSGGYTLEMYHHKTGYAPNEPVATHSRRRYRLLPSKFPNPGNPSPDPSLWIIHYTQAEPQERVPSNVIPVDMRTQQIMSTRAYLQSHGQIMQKEFMLHDRANWPQIAFPRGPPRGPSMYSANMPPARIPQTMAYPTQQATAGPPAKRVRTTASASQGAATNPAVHDADDEEDTSRGDLFDHTTPREISMARYKQNHEWMEEILSSPYAINQIIPADLGLGVRGELAGLTEGIFDAPLDPEKDVVKYNYVGRLDPEKAEEFRKRAAEQIEKTTKEIEKMKAKHSRRMAKFQKGALITAAEKQLRSAVDNPSDTGPEYWRLEGRIDQEDNDEDKVLSTEVPPKVSDIVAKVEASVGRHAAAVKELIRIQDGGYEEAPAIPSPQAPAIPTPHITPPASQNGSQNSGLVGDADMDMSNSAAGLLDQYHTGLSSNATPGSNFPTPQGHLHGLSSAGTPSNLHATSPGATLQSAGQELGQHDTPMADTGSNEKTISTDATGTGDWVVVPPGGVSPTDAQGQVPPTAAGAEIQIPNPIATSAEISNPSPLPITTAGTSAVNTPGLPDFHTSPNDFADLGDLDTAGDALASYGDEMGGDGDLGDLGMDMDVGLDDSAFGEAFHGVEPRDHGEGDVDTPGMGDGL